MTTEIEFTQGDILTSDADALVNTVNRVGTMGRGLALQFKRAFPANFQAYMAACSRKELRPGRMLVSETGLPTNPKYIINFPTKRHWRDKSRIEDIRIGLVALVQVARDLEVRSVALPALGAGLGGLGWDDLRSEIVRSLCKLDAVRVIVFEPHNLKVN